MSKSTLGDAYLKFEEEGREVSVFSVDDVDAEEKPAATSAVSSASVEARPPAPPSHAPSVVVAQVQNDALDEPIDDIFSNSGSKKNKKSKKHRKKTTGKSVTPPPPDEE